MKSILLSVCAVLKTLYDRFFEDHCPSRAASLAYTTLLSIVPLIMVSVYILSWVPAFKGVGPEVQKFILQNFVAGSANVISVYLNDFIGHLRELSMTNIGFLGVVSILLIYNMVGAFNEIWHVRMETHFAIAFAIYLLVLLITPILFAILLLVISYFSSFNMPVVHQLTAWITTPIAQVFPYLFELFIFSFFNYVLPSTRVRMGPAVVAGLITTGLFEIAKFGFGLYLHFVPTYRLIYGALATIPIFLIWLYVTWLIILVGALCCHLLSLSRAKCTVRNQ